MTAEAEIPVVTPASEVSDPAGEWLGLVDRALRGIHHALNNRIGSLSALVELQQFGDLPTDGSAFDTIGADVARLNDCSRVVGLLPADVVAGEEAVLLPDLLADVLTIHRFLHDTRDVAVSMVPSPFVEPVRVERWALVRVLTMVLAEAKGMAVERHASVSASMSSSDETVQVEFRVGSAPGSDGAGDEDAMPQDPMYADRLAGAIGGTIARRGRSVSLRMPTLKARRAADRR